MSETSDHDVEGATTRVKTLTERGEEQYELKLKSHRAQFERAWKNVELCFDVSEIRPAKLATLWQARAGLNESHRHFVTISKSFRDFLCRTNTLDSLRDLESLTSVISARELPVKQTLSQLENQIEQIIETASHTSGSSKSHSSKSSHPSDISAILAQKKAQADATKTRVEYAIKEAEIRKQQAIHTEKQKLFAAQTARIQAELEADLDILKTEGQAAEAAAEFQALQNISDDIPIASLPVENSRERTERYVEHHNIVSEPKHHFKTELGTPANAQHINLNPPTNFIANSQPQQLPNHTLNHNATPYKPIMPPYDQSVNANPVHLPGTVNFATEMTQYLLKKELLLTRLSKFNDQPESYSSWKSGFLSIVHDLHVTPVEELELLVKWLGPESVKHAISLKTSNVNNPERGLQRIWDRLDERFGSPEMVEAALKLKLERFPKLTNKDVKELYELADILSEIESVKEDTRYSSLFAYFDSSAGVNPIVNKLPYGIQERWTGQAIRYKQSRHVSFPPFSYFVDFMREISRTKNDPSFVYESTVNTSQRKVPPKNNSRMNFITKKTDVAERISETVSTCPLHKTNHSLNQCRGFRMRTLEERKKLIKENGICFRCCASTQHMARACKATTECTECHSTKHATALHVEHSITGNHTSTSPEANVGGENIHSCNPSTVTSKCTQICGTQFGGKSCSKNILVNIYPRGCPQKSKRVYAILDEQSNVSLARSEFFDSFDEHSDSVPYTLSSCSGPVKTAGRRARNYVVEALDGSGQAPLPIVVECNQIPNCREEIPTPAVAQCYPHLVDIANLIPPLDDNSPILLLIGRDVPIVHHILEQRIGPQNSPYAQRTRLGWVIIGETCLGKVHKPNTINVNKTHILDNGRPSLFIPCTNKLDVRNSHVVSEATLVPTDSIVDSDIGSKIFAITKDDNKLGTSVEDREFINLMEREFIRDSDGSWIAPLPFRTPRRSLPNNRLLAVKRAKALHNSLIANPVKKQHFFDFMGKILNSGHAKLAPQLEAGEECWYLPLFGVYHPKKPDQIRGVFDSSASLDGISLNDVLLKGPDLTNSLLGILMRFRTEPIAVTADIQQMFYCFKVREDHRNYLRFLWYRNNDIESDLVDYRMNVHVFGNRPSPAVATYGLRMAAGDQNDVFGEDVSKFVKRDFYVDDALTSLPTPEVAVSLIKRTQQALASCGNINLHKIASNSREVMESFPPGDRANDLKDLDLGTDVIPLQHSLGMCWDLKTDSFTFQVSPDRKPFTRRGVLSTISSVFDPIGFVAPVIVGGKVLLRELMTGGVDWDDPLPPNREREWNQWKDSLQAVQDIQIPRMYVSLSNPARRDIFIYSDASEKAIAAVAYMIGTDADGNREIGFVFGKNKLAPVHGHTIPRLELCAAVLAVEIAEVISVQLNISLDTIKYFTDSKVVLGYISNQTRRFYTYVSNRVERIRKSSTPQQWNYIPTHLNPADAATRVMFTSDLENSIWLSGPANPRASSNVAFPLSEPEHDKEVRPQITVLATKLSEPDCLGSDRFLRFSSWQKLVEAIMRLRHIVKTFQNQNICSGWHTCRESSTVKNYSETEQFIIKQVQYDAYSEDIECIRNAGALPKNSPIRSLSPIIDEDGVLRVGGRLSQSKLELEGRNPIIIPGKYHIATLLIRHHHEKVQHQGRHITEGAVRAAGLWITGCKRLISSLCHNCVKCRKLRGTQSHQKMADLPSDRVTPAPPFTYVGVDAFGHWSIVTRRTRGGAANSKRWAIMFSCLVTRAIHIEVIEDMSTSAFINALRRFIAIRGKVKQFRSDRGTNFIGSTDELKIDTINVEDGPVRGFLYNTGVEWIFNPPHSSHMGGSWERMIGVARRILDSVLSTVASNNLTHDVLVTFMAEVCAIINARPIVPVSTDPEDPFILSPNTLLTQKTDNSVEQLTSCDPREMYQAQWKRVQLLADIFWKRWRQEYLHTLQARRKWTDTQRNIQQGDVVLLKDKNLKRNEWPLGLVVNPIPGSDDNIRKAVVRVVKGDKCAIYTRPISEMILLLPNA